MHKYRNRILLFGSTAALGGLSMVLHQYMTEHFMDHKGLLIAGNLPGTLLWVVGIGYALFLLAMLQTIGGEGSYEDNFPRCLLSGSMMLAAGATLFLAVPELKLLCSISAGQQAVTAAAQLSAWLMDYLPYAAAASMALLGVFRMAGKRPPYFFSSLICLMYILTLLSSYRRCSTDPQLHSYVYPMLAQVLLMLASFHRVCCDAGIIQRKRLLFAGLGAAFCCTAALSGSEMCSFHLASGLWAAGSMCNVVQLPPDPEEEPEEGPGAEPEEPTE